VRTGKVCCRKPPFAATLISKFRRRPEGSGEARAPARELAEWASGEWALPGATVSKSSPGDRLRLLYPPRRYTSVAADESGVSRDLAGHLRFGVNGGIEFAAGYNDLLLARSIVTGAALRGLSPSRGWIHVLATGERSAPVTFASCNCGAHRRAFRPDLRLRLE